MGLPLPFILLFFYLLDSFEDRVLVDADQAAPVLLYLLALLLLLLLAAFLFGLSLLQVTVL